MNYFGLFTTPIVTNGISGYILAYVKAGQTTLKH